MKDGISIIIPCYNVEKYIEKCLDSISKQNIGLHEIILIDDCSKDKTAEVIEKYIKEHKNSPITFLKNEKNSGAGASRNRAVKEAKYDVISFIDSDDYIEDNFYESMISTMKKTKADVVVCDIFVRGDEISYRCVACEGKNERINYINNGLAASPCNKLIKKELLLKYPFAEGIMNEDIPAIIACLVYARNLAYDANTYYNYIQHETSVQNKSFSEKRFNIFKAIDILNDRIKDCKNYKNIWNAVVYQQIIMFFIYVMPKEKNYFKRAKYLKKFYKLSKNLKIRQNNLFWNFLELQGKKHKYYYKLLAKLNDNGFSYTTSFFILLYDTYKKMLLKPVIKKNISMKDVEKAAIKQSKMKSNITVSVVIPNYNYEKFMFERLYSILYQTYKINEVIILDDCSKDNSRKLIDEIENKIGKYIPIKKIYNKENSGCVFKQWQKGFEEAKSDYVWIAEADDYCDKKFLKANINQIKKDKDIVLSYADTGYIDKVGNIIGKSVIPDIDLLETHHWDESYIIDGNEEIKKYSYLNCTIANVSSVIFKNDKYDDIFKKAMEYKQAGDWRFYLGIYEKGKVSFVGKTLNYYRVHGDNVTSLTKKQAHFDEIKMIHNELDEKIKFNGEQKKKIKQRYKFLVNMWHVK